MLLEKKNEKIFLCYSYKAYMQEILKGIVSGILSAYLILYGLRPAIPNPEIILEVFENKWIILVLLILNYYVFVWDYTAGALFLLCIISLIFDYIVFTQRGFKKVARMGTVTPVTPVTPVTSSG